MSDEKIKSDAVMDFCKALSDAIDSGFLDDCADTSSSNLSLMTGQSRQKRMDDAAFKRETDKINREVWDD